MPQHGRRMDSSRRPCACGCNRPARPGSKYAEGAHCRRRAFEARHPRVDRVPPEVLAEMARNLVAITKPYAEECDARRRAQREEAETARFQAVTGDGFTGLTGERPYRSRRNRPQRRVWLPPDAWAVVGRRAAETGERPSEYVARLVREQEHFLETLARAVAGGRKG